MAGRSSSLSVRSPTAPAATQHRALPMSSSNTKISRGGGAVDERSMFINHKRGRQPPEVSAKEEAKAVEDTNALKGMQSSALGRRKKGSVLVIKRELILNRK